MISELHLGKQKKSNVFFFTCSGLLWGRGEGAQAEVTQVISAKSTTALFLFLSASFSCLTNKPERSVQTVLHLPPFERGVPQLLLKRAAHAALLHAQDVSLGVAYELAHHRRVPQRVDERLEGLLVVGGGSDLEVRRGQDAQDGGDPAELLHPGRDPASGFGGQREGDEHVRHSRYNPGDDVDRIDQAGRLVDPCLRLHGRGKHAVGVVAQRGHEHHVHRRLALLKGGRLNAHADGVCDEGYAGSGEVEGLKQSLVGKVVETALGAAVLLWFAAFQQLLLDSEPHRRREGHAVQNAAGTATSCGSNKLRNKAIQAMLNNSCCAQS